jgi:hypothetical protein
MLSWRRRAEQQSDAMGNDPNKPQDQQPKPNPNPNPNQPQQPPR